MPRYSPFEKTIEDLNPEDLEALRSAAEGWYVEYKRESSKAEAMAKSVSAFANTHGGWLFYGVEEKSKEESVAGAFPGIPRAEIDPTMQRLRQAIANAVNPSPHYEARAIWGPCEQIGLVDDHAVICVYVPKGPNSPYVHKSGQIYRRVADGSEPKPENDRFVLDQLWRRSNDILEEYKERVSGDPELSKGEGDRPYVRLLMVADLWGDRDAWLDAPISEVRELLRNEVPTMSAIPFDTVHTTSNGFVGRQLRNNNPHNLGLTFRLQRDLVSELIIPLDLYAPNHCSELRSSLGDFSQSDVFCDILEARGYESPRVVDLNFLFNVLISMADLQHKIMKRAGWQHGYHSKTVLLNVWRTIPFLDAPMIMQEFNTFGVPMILDGRVTSPAGSHPDSFVRVKEYEDVEEPQVRIALQGLDMFRPIAEAFGIPTWLPHEESESVSFLQELLEVGQSALSAQTARNERRAK